VPQQKTLLETLATTVQVLSVVVGVVVSIVSFNATRQKEAEARRQEAERPFVELRRSVYLETVKTAAVLANTADRTAEEMAKAKRRFRELYVAELAMVETLDVEQDMVALATAVDPELRELSSAQQAALQLSHALGKSFATRPADR